MSEDEPIWREGLDEDEQRLVLLLADRMNSAAFTKKALFDMSEKYECHGNILGLSAIFASGLVATGAAINLLSTPWVIFLSILAGFLSFAATYLNPNEDAIVAEKTAEEYNRLLNRYMEYYHLTLRDENISYEEKKEELKRLLIRHETINRHTTSTDEDMAKQVDSEEVLSEIETTPEEMDRLLDDNRTVEEMIESDGTEPAVDS